MKLTIIISALNEERTIKNCIERAKAFIQEKGMALNNHSYLHYFFTYRALASTVTSLITIIYISLRKPGI